MRVRFGVEFEFFVVALVGRKLLEMSWRDEELTTEETMDAQKSHSKQE